jgi:hypothetical protein
MSAFEEETKGDGILLFYIFLREHVGYTKEVIIAAEQQLTKEKLALENFDHDISRFTTHARTYLCQIMNVGSPITNQHFIIIFSALKEASEEEFKLTSTKAGAQAKAMEQTLIFFNYSREQILNTNG